MRCAKRLTTVAKFGCFAISLLLLSGCMSAPTREDTKEFTVLDEGRVPPQRATAFADCLVEGFDRAHWMVTNISTRQLRRADSTRVESLTAGRMLLVSADVFDDGRVQLLESSTAALINTSGQRSTFKKCLATHAVPQR